MFIWNWSVRGDGGAVSRAAASSAMGARGAGLGLLQCAREQRALGAANRGALGPLPAALRPPLAPPPLALAGSRASSTLWD